MDNNVLFWRSSKNKLAKLNIFAPGSDSFMWDGGHNLAYNVTWNDSVMDMNDGDCVVLLGNAEEKGWGHNGWMSVQCHISMTSYLGTYICQTKPHNQSSAYRVTRSIEL